jgi:hypothetical protein
LRVTTKDRELLLRLLRESGRYGLEWSALRRRGLRTTNQMVADGEIVLVKGSARYLFAPEFAPRP